MAKSSFNVTIVSKQLLLQLRKSMVANSIVNRNYAADGEIRLGEKVDILTPAGLTIGSYAAGTDISVQELNSSKQTLTVDQGDYFAFYAHRPERIADYVSAFAEEGAYGLADEADAYVMGLYAQAQLSVDYEPGTGDILAAVREARRKMSVAGAPEAGRWLVLSPYEIEAIDAKLTGRNTPGTDEVVARGFVGQLYGFDVYSSGNVAEKDDVRYGLFGTNACITLADAVSEISAMEAEKRFATLVKGLHVYGAEVVRAEIFGALKVDLS